MPRGRGGAGREGDCFPPWLLQSLWPRRQDCCRLGTCQAGRHGAPPVWPPARGKLRLPSPPSCQGSALPSPLMLCGFFHLFCKCFGARALRQRPGCPAHSRQTTTGRTGSTGCLGAATLPLLPAPVGPAAVLASPSPEVWLLLPWDVPRSRAFPRFPPQHSGLCSDAAGAGAQPWARGTLVPLRMDRGGQPSTDRNLVPASAASFSEAALSV